jgi:L-ribulose-5-phosphate 4-epimerase
MSPMTAHAPLIAELIRAGRRAVDSGLVIGSGGNLSARLPGADVCVVTASGTWLDDLRHDSFSVVDLDGGWVDGNPAPSSEVALHLASYRARPDATAIIHLHPQHCVLLDAMDREIRLVTIDHAYYVRRIARVPWIRSGTQELADAGAAALADGCNCVLLGHHGCSVVADSVDLAYKRAANLEEAAVATYRALLLGDTTTAVPQAYVDFLSGGAAAGV